MGRRLAPLALVASAAVALSAGQSVAAFYLMVAAVPLTAVSGLVAFGELVDHPGVARLRLETALAAVMLVALLTAALLVGR